MIRPSVLWAAALQAALAAVLHGQERVWTVGGGGDGIYSLDAFGDYNGDGYCDLLVGVGTNITSPFPFGELRILSGVDGAVLYRGGFEFPARSAGDLDGDGVRDYAAIGLGPTYLTWSINAVSLASHQTLWSQVGPAGYFGYISTDMSLMVGDLDLTGDGRPDYVAITSDSRESDVYAYDNSGALLYRIPVRQFGWIALNVAAMPDLDGDGGAEFLVGCAEPTGRGAVAVISGRTGTTLRISYGLQPGSAIGGSICNAGDVDGDGVSDYAATSYLSGASPGFVVFSGATGALLRSREGLVCASGAMVGDIDVDLDGVPDLVQGSGEQVATSVYGKVRAFSGRDGNVLWTYNAPADRDELRPWPMVNLGVLPGSPYPVIAMLDHSWTPLTGLYSENRIIAMRVNLRGAGPVTGVACASNGSVPQIGMRQVPGHTRITVAHGPPGALAWLVGGPAGQTVFGGVVLPQSLDPLGLLGCTALVPPVVVAPTLLGTVGIDAGYAAIDLPWPVLSPTGMAFAAQWLMLEPTSGAYAVTARHEFRVP